MLRWKKILTALLLLLCLPGCSCMSVLRDAGLAQLELQLVAQ